MTWRMALPALAAVALLAATAYQTEIAQWHSQREERLKSEGGWLSVAGLFWLHEGANPFGKDPGNEIVLPDGAARAGVFDLHNGKVTVRMDGVTRELWPDSQDVVKVGRLSLLVIKRSDKFGIRLKDPDSQYRREFHGIESFPTQEAYRVTDAQLQAGSGDQRVVGMGVLRISTVHNGCKAALGEESGSSP